MQLWDLVDELVLNFAFGLGFCLFCFVDIGPRLIYWVSVFLD